MPQVKKNKSAALLTLLCLLFMLAACGSQNSQAPFDPDTGGHAEGWDNPFIIGADNFHATGVIKVKSDLGGAILYSTRCAICHGSNATGKIGPPIQGQPASFFSDAIRTVRLMKSQSDLNSKELQEIADYIETLKAGAVPVPIERNTETCLDCHGKDLDGGISGISCFSCHNGPGGDIGHPDGWGSPETKAAHFHGRYGKDFSVSCKNCHGIDLKGGIARGCSACHDGAIAPVLELLKASGN